MPNHFEISPRACINELLRVGLAEHGPSELSDIEVPFITDSRAMVPGAIFLAYRGVSFNSHQILDLIIAQKPALIIHEEPFETELVPTLCVNDARAAWAQLASFAYGHPGDDLVLIGVTGTNGKTSTVHFIRKLIEKNSASIGTLGAFIGDESYLTVHTTPDPPELYRFLAKAKEAKVTCVAMEASSHALVQQKLFPLRFSIVIFTSFTRDHLDLHHTMEEYWFAKVRLFSELTTPHSVALVSSTVPNAEALIRLIEDKISQVIVYGDKAGNIRPFARIDKIEYTRHITKIHTTLNGNSFVIKSRLVGDFACQNLLAAALAESLLRSRTGILNDLEHIDPPPGRLELVQSDIVEAPKVFVDYSHTPDAITGALQALRRATSGKLWIIFGCGGNRDIGKRPLMAQAAESDADEVIVTTDNPRHEDADKIISDIVSGFKIPGKVTVKSDRRDAIRFAIQSATAKDTVLIAGKGHETYMEIKGEKHYFSDIEEARHALSRKSTLRS